MTFQIKALEAAEFAPLFAMEDDALALQNGRRVVVDKFPGFPCRISLQDAELGEEVILVNFQHQPAASPFQAAHAIYVRLNVARACPAPGEVPEMMRLRLNSLRGFDAQDEICKADVVKGENTHDMLTHFFNDPAVRYVHIHNAKLGCFTARADPA